MLTFTPINENTAEEVGRYYSLCPYRISDYSLGLKMMWRYMLDSEYTVSHGCFVVRSKIRGRYAFDYPFPVEENADILAALSDMADFCSENFLPFEFSAVPREFVHVILERYPNVEDENLPQLQRLSVCGRGFHPFFREALCRAAQSCEKVSCEVSGRMLPGADPRRMNRLSMRSGALYGGIP